MSLKKADDRVFASVLADGRIHISVPEGTPGSVVRKYETSDGKEGSKIEMVYTQIIGKITNISFYEGDFGRQLQLTIDAGKGTDKPFVLSLSTSSNFGEDMMKKLPNVDLKKPVKISPYSFVDDKKKNKKGITIWQHDGKKAVKIENYYYDAKAKKNIHDYPEPKKGKGGKPLSKDQWKLYFGEVREFLVEQMIEIFKIEETQVSGTDGDKELEDFVASSNSSEEITADEIAEKMD